MKPYRFDDLFQFIAIKTVFYILPYKNILGHNSSTGVCLSKDYEYI